MVEVSPAPIDVVIDLVNGWSARVRQAAGEADSPYPALAEVLAEHPPTAPTSDAELAEIADRLHTVFAESSAARRIAALNAAIRAADPTPLISPAGPRWAIRETGGALEACLLMSLAEHARQDPGLERIGTCDAHRCVDAYIDTSQAHTRRYCSLTCQNRVKAAAYRRRHRA